MRFQYKLLPCSESAHREVERAEDDNAKKVEGEAKVGGIPEVQQTVKTRDHRQVFLLSILIV